MGPVRNNTSANSNARLLIESAVDEVKEDETIKQHQGDVEMLNVDQNFITSAKNQEGAYNNHDFIQ